MYRYLYGQNKRIVDYVADQESRRYITTYGSFSKFLKNPNLNPDHNPNPNPV